MTRLKCLQGALLAAGSLLALAACGAETDATLETAAPEEAAAADVAGCGPALPITGLCSNAVEDQFLMTFAEAPKLATKCVWKTQEVGITPSDAIVFRVQDCTAEGWVANTYEVVQNYVKSRMDGTPSDQAVFILEFLPLAPGETAQQAALKTLAKAPEGERDRCEVRPRSGEAVVGDAFDIAPNEALTTEMNTTYPDEPWDACGPNGYTQSAIQYWEARETYALFHMLGQDDPSWDPASFTFYRKGDDGNWVKAG